MPFVKDSNETYIIAEIGQNHNGDMDICKKLIDQLIVYPYDTITGERLNTINAIKLTKRDLDEELSKEGMDAPYNGVNSFGKTYGEHREFLEFSYFEHLQIADYVRNKGVDFVDTLCSKKTLQLAGAVDKIKVASRDLTNIPLLHAIAETDSDVIISTGMADKSDLITAIGILDRSVTILHCLSQYPAEYSRLNLMSIKYLEEEFGGEHTIGYSDHSMGIHIPLAAVAMGAKVIEKHVTLDRNMKGTDHSCSAEPQEMKRMVHDIRTFERSLGKRDVFIDDSVKDSSKKLSRSLATYNLLLEGDVIKEEDIHMISPGDGLKWSDLEKVVGRRTNKIIPPNTLISIEDLE